MNSGSGIRNRWLIRVGWLMPMLVAIAVYSVAFNNYFTFDDFIWLSRARTFKQDWLQIFHVDVTYFDPLVHLVFWVNFLVAGLDPRWYHGVDLAIHATNSLLIYRFARLLSGDERSSLYGGVLFASSFAIADAVLWSSSRVDLLSTLCALGALTQFLHYLRLERRRHLFLSLLLFILALGAKGTPLVLPLIFLWLIIQEKKPLSYAQHLVPFGVVIIIYVVLLRLNMHQASLPLDKLHFNIGNLAIAFCALFIPEETLKHLNLTVAASLLLVTVTALALPTTLSFNKTVMLRRTGYVIILAAILPVLILTDFVLVTEYSNPYKLLGSPSHRIYFASVGAALLGGGLLRSIEMLLKNFFPRFSIVAVGALLVGVVIGNALLVKERSQLWESAGKPAQYAVVGLLSYRQHVAEGAQVGLINFPSSAAFLTAMMKVSFDLNEVTQINPVYIGMIKDPEKLPTAEKAFLFILDGSGQVHDKSQSFRQQLLLNRVAIQNPSRFELTDACLVNGAKLNKEIDELIR